MTSCLFTYQQAVLHVNCPNVQENAPTSKHQLDSNATPDVLRLVAHAPAPPSSGNSFSLVCWANVV